MRSANHRRVAILGSGIAGLIASRIIDNAVVITKKHMPLYFNNVYIHDTIENRAFIKLFANMPIRRREVPFYYFNAETKIIGDTITPDERLILIREKMDNVNIEINDTTISTKKEIDEKFYVLDFDPLNLEENLSDKIYIGRWNLKWVEEFDDRVELTDNNGLVLTYDYIINTIPQNFFNQMLGTTYDDKFNFVPLTFVTGDNIFPNASNYFEGLNASDYMIYAYNNSTWKRIFRKGGITMIEYNGHEISDEVINSEFPTIENIKKQVVPYGRIISNPVKDSKRIIHVGRFAQWDHSITMEHVINKLLNLNLYE